MEPIEGTIRFKGGPHKMIQFDLTKTMIRRRIHIVGPRKNNENNWKKTMKNSTSFIKIVWVSILVGILQSCASLPAEIDTPTRSDVKHTIMPGDQLGDIALRYTGKISRWEAIAAYNNIQDPRSLRLGAVVTIPARLLSKSYSPVTGRTITVARKNSLKAASISNTPGKQITTTASSTLAVKRSSNYKGVATHPISVNRTFTLTPLAESTNPVTPTQPATAPQVKVIGTYYPKGIYKQPASYAPLIMRVAPGSVFTLEREVNDWYKIMTEDGTGYLRAEDGTVLTANQP